ncbi:hypothetical protein HZC09_01555 [Candidatus Micrarchaeota archaeon]|nr:hypothetical protein [Candidatus Micrarchaeota archaeon]
MSWKSIVLNPDLTQVFFKPEETFKGIAKKASGTTAVLYIGGVATIIAASLLLLNAMVPVMSKDEALQMIVLPIATVFKAIIWIGISWSLAKLLGGKESFVKHLYGIALTFPVLTILHGLSTIIATAMTINPLIAYLPVIVLQVYYQYVLIRTNHKLGKIRSAIATLGVGSIVLVIGLFLLAGHFAPSSFVGSTAIPIYLNTPVETPLMESLTNVTERRLQTFGLYTARVRPVGKAEILVELPPTNSLDIKKIEELLASEGRFEALVDGRQVLNNSDIIISTIGGRGAQHVSDDGQWALVFAITGDSELNFAELARDKVGENVYMFLDRPQNAAIILDRNAEGQGSEQALQQALRKEGDDILIYYTQDFDAKKNEILASNRSTILAEENLPKKILSELEAAGYSLQKNASRKIILKAKEQMTPKMVSFHDVFDRPKTTVASWKAVGLLSAPTLQVEPIRQRVITQYAISGTAEGATPIERKANAEAEMLEVKSVLRSGVLPVGVIVGAYYNITSEENRVS